MSQISKSSQSSESDTDFIQEITINSVYGDSIGSENDTPAKAKRGLNKIYTKFKEYDTYKEAIEDIKKIKDYIDKVSQNEWESFFDLFEKINEIREILFDDTNWKLSRCSCCYW